MTTFEERKKQRQAALKAWKTIKNRKRERAARYSKRITQYIAPHSIQRIKHPETSHFPETLQVSWKGNRIVVPFHKTPLSIACGQFWELRWAYGCPLDCSYCYLRGTMRGRMTPQYVKTEHVIKALDEAFMEIHTPAIFNAGELADALMNPAMMVPIIDKYEEQDKHKIYLLTKFGVRNVEFLLDKPRQQVILGWSINAPPVAKLWERSAPSPKKRMEAAELAKTAGYDTRIRIDPIFPISDWKSHYGDLLNEILEHLTPNRIILGTPRGLWKTIKYAKEALVDMSWTQFFAEDTGWGKKIAFKKREEIYRFFYDKLNQAGYPLFRVSICKETIEMMHSLSMHYAPGVCNCYGLKALLP